MRTAYSLYRRYSQQELVTMSLRLDNDPENHEPPGSNSLFKLNEAARKQSSAIAQAIAWHREDARARSGRPVPTCGYSGRNQNRR